MPNAFRQALEHGEFAVSCELVPGRGARGPAVEAVLSTAREIWRTGRVHALTVADNPGGNPALLADGVAIELLRDGVTPLVHFTCKDRNRSQIVSQLCGLERQGVENVLLMTGDYQAGGWEGRARPVFDLDSVQAQLLASQMNAGLARTGHAGGPAGGALSEPTHFFPGCAMNPFKYRAGEVVPQYLKLEKKLAAGARFVVSQVGYDARKMQELLFYLADRGYHVPVIANVFVLSEVAAHRMRAGLVPGCHVSDALMGTLEREAQAPDGGRAARLERAAAQVAVARGLGFSGVHIGGAGVDAQTVTWVLDRAERLVPDWRACLGQVAFGEAGGFYLYEPVPAGDAGEAAGGAAGGGAVLNSPVRAALAEDVTGRERALFEGYDLSRLAHYWALTPGKRLNGAFGQVMEVLDERRGRFRRHRLEHAQKAALYGCVDCGDCGLEACFYSCPMTQCPKCQRNGPCGGSADGWCEVFPEGSDGARLCIWYKAYHRARRVGKLDLLGSFITLPNRWEFCGSSAWSNYTHGRDNCSRRLPVSLGSDRTEAPGRGRGAAPLPGDGDRFHSQVGDAERGNDSNEERE